MRKVQDNRLTPCQSLFQKKLDGTLVLLGVISASGIDEHATRLEEVDGAKEERPLECHQSRPGSNGGGDSPVDAHPERSLGGAGHVNEHPVEAAMEGELLAGVKRSRIGNPESLEVGG